MTNLLLLLALGAAVIDWIAVAKNWKVVEYIFKPMTMLALLAWLWTTAGVQGVLILFALGIFFSLLGDVFLMLPANLFIPGLVAFLLAHIAYIRGFNQTLPPFSLIALIPILIVFISFLLIYRKLSTGLTDHRQSGLKIPVFVYAIVISLMLLSAVFTFLKSDWVFPSTALVSIGALLFYISDAILAWNKFISPIQNGRLMNISTYHMGQILLITGVALNFFSTNV